MLVDEVSNEERLEFSTPRTNNVQTRMWRIDTPDILCPKKSQKSTRNDISHIHLGSNILNIHVVSGELDTNGGPLSCPWIHSLWVICFYPGLEISQD